MGIKLLLPFFLVGVGFAASAHAEPSHMGSNRHHELNSVYLQQLATHNPFSNVYSARSGSRVDISRWSNNTPVKAEPSQLWPTNRKPVGFVTISKSSVSKAAISKASISKTSKIDKKYAKPKPIENIDQEVADAIIADIFMHGDQVVIANVESSDQPVQSSDNEVVNNDNRYVVSAASKTTPPQTSNQKVESKRTASYNPAPVRQWSL